MKITVDPLTGLPQIVNEEVKVFSSSQSGAIIQSGGSSFSPLTPQAAPAYAAGTLFYDSASQSLTFYNDDSNVMMNIGQESWIKVINNTGVAIANGVPVYINGASGGFPSVALGAATTALLANISGVTTEAIANGATGYITCTGIVRGINTSAFAVGALLYLSATPGAMTVTQPAAGNFSTIIGEVVTSNATTGSIIVDMNQAPTFVPQAAATDLATVLAAQGLRTAGAAYSLSTSGNVTFTAGLRLGFSTPTAATTLTTSSAPYQMANATTAAFNITLPAAASPGVVYTVKKTDATANAVTIVGTIDGLTNYTLSTQYKYVSLVGTSVAGSWLIVGNN